MSSTRCIRLFIIIPITVIHTVKAVQIIQLFFIHVPLAGFEPAVPWSVARCSVH